MAFRPTPPPRRGLKVALAQIAVEDGEIAINMRLAEEAAREAASRNADMLCLPEAADWGWLHQESRRDAFPIPGKYTDCLTGLATRHRMWIAAGCLERDGENVYNSAVIIDRAGIIVLKHRKISTLPRLTKHLYDAGRSKDIKTADTEFGRIGLTICADNFAVKHPQKVANRGAWLLIAPHGFAEVPKKLEHNAAKFQNHISKVAAKTGLWVVATNTVLGEVRAGAWKGRLHSGCSTISRPDGTPAIVAKFEEPDLVVFEIPAE